MSRLSTIGRGVVVALWMTACDAPALPDAATGDDAGGVCGSDARCDDGLFCTGVERCDPAHPSADARGCVVVPACAATEACDEDARACVPRDGGADGGECDADGDGHASIACGGDDCDDADAQRFPGNVERCEGTLAGGLAAADHDEDCDPCTVAGALPDGDRDDDRFVSAGCSNPWLDAEPIGCNLNQVRVQVEERRVVGADCDDDPATGANVRPNQVEVCGNLVDDNCDGAVDEGRFYRDLDNDGRGDPAVEMTGSCMPGWVTNADDCDDTRSETYLGARELCDGLDNDCSLPGAAAGGPDPSEDMDGDGHSPLSATCLGRGEPGAPGFAFPKDDCDDSDATIYTGADEICGNGIDEDCDRIPDNPTQRICTDADGDDHGSPATLRTIDSCEVPAGHVPEARCDDCNDAQPSAFPGNREICDRLDNDCSSGGGVDASEDVDGDGYAPIGAACAGRGEAGVPETAFPRTDCDDSVATTHPGVTDVCDRLDADCSSGGGVALDEDADNDGHAPIGATCLARGEPGAPSTAFPADDCDDTTATVHGGVPASTDYATCDGVDNDCDPSTSELTSAEACSPQGYCGAGGACGRRLEVLEIVSGADHTCARLADGSARCWGENDSGQLGDGTTIDRVEPVAVEALPRSVQLAAGSARTCSLAYDGTVQCWGGTPAAVTGLSGVVEVRSGIGHACARLADGTVRCWGTNSSGQVGDGTTVTRPSPVEVPGLTGVRGLALGNLHSCALLEDHTVRCWGHNNSGQVGTGSIGANVLTPTAVVGLSGVESIRAGSNHTCALLASGAVRCWGINSNGQLGDGSTTARATPVDPGLTSIASVWAGGSRTCAISSTGTLRCWGSNNRRQLGPGTTASMETRPVVVPGVSDVAEMALELYVSCARRVDGAVHCWGDNDPTPRRVEALRGVASLAAFSSHTCAGTADVELHCWGANTHGQLGDGTGLQRTSPVLVGSAWLPDMELVALATGGLHTCAAVAVGTDSEVLCWGDNSWGQLGDDSTTPRQAPEPVAGVAAGAIELVAGSYHTCARLADGTVQCWGNNVQGQLGIGTSESRRLSPTAVPGLSGVTALASGRWHVCALRSTGTVVCWGDNTYGQLGDGSTTDRSSPTAVSGLTSVASIGAGDEFSCAVRTTGELRCWGRNSSRQLGDGTMTDRSTPVAVSGLSNAAQMGGGAGHACARTTDGRLWCWGSNTQGQLGDGTTLMRSTPSMVPGLERVFGVATGGAYTCAVLDGGATYCWGQNAAGQLGNATTVNSTVPSLVREL